MQLEQLKSLKSNARQGVGHAARVASVLTVAVLSLGAVNAEPVGTNGTFVARTNTLNPAPLAVTPVAPVVKQEIATETAAAPQAVTATTTKKRSGGGGCSLETIKQRESGGRYTATSASGKYRGAYQFDQRTWQSVGGSGDPAAASPAEQDSRAAALYAKRGSKPWTTC
jgi:hypothetical protein